MILAALPKIGISIEVKGESIVRSKLFLSDHFTSDIKGASFELQEALDAWLLSYAKRKEPIFNFPIDLNFLTDFQRKTLFAMLEIPFGKTVSYKDLGTRIGMDRGWRAIGGACKKNPFPLFIPCHRVTGTGGKMGGFAFDLEIKKRLLDFELPV